MYVHFWQRKADFRKLSTSIKCQAPILLGFSNQQDSSVRTKVDATLKAGHRIAGTCSEVGIWKDILNVSVGRIKKLLD